MTALTVVLATVAAAGLLFTYCLIRALLHVAKTVQDRATRERTLHGEQIARLVEDMAGERREWAQERHILLNRIQDPPAGVAASMTLLPQPEPGALDVDLER